MSLTFVLRVLLLNPVILAGIFVLLVPFVIWLTHRFLASGAGIGVTLDRPQHLVGLLVAVSLFAGVLTAISGRWGAGMGDLYRLRSLQRTAVARESPPGVRLLSERRHISSYAGIDEYTADVKDAPDTTSYKRIYRVEGSLPEVVAGFDRLASGSGWKHVATGCGPRMIGSVRESYATNRIYERRVSGFRATLSVSSRTLPSQVYPGTVIADIDVTLRAPSVLVGKPAPVARKIDQSCAPLVASPKPPAPPGACPAAERKLAAAVPEAAALLGSRPLPVPQYPSDLRRMRVRSSDDDIVASSNPSEPRPLLERHGAIDGYQDYDRISGSRDSAGYRAATYAYQFPSAQAARSFHQEAVARACAQATEFFDVPGIPDAVGLRLYVPAVGRECTGHHLWGLGFGQCDDFLMDYVAFARGQYHLSVVVGGPEEDRLDPPAIRGAVLKLAPTAAGRACEVREQPAPRSCR